jgi:hypothetical protein
MVHSPKDSTGLSWTRDPVGYSRRNIDHMPPGPACSKTLVAAQATSPFELNECHLREAQTVGCCERQQERRHETCI